MGSQPPSQVDSASHDLGSADTKMFAQLQDAASGGTKGHRGAPRPQVRWKTGFPMGKTWENMGKTWENPEL